MLISLCNIYVQCLRIHPSDRIVCIVSFPSSISIDEGDIGLRQIHLLNCVGYFLLFFYLATFKFVSNEVFSKRTSLNIP